LKSQVFRIIAWCLAVGVTALWVLQQGEVTLRKAELDDIEAKLKAAKDKTRAVEADSNATKATLIQETNQLEEEDKAVTEEMNTLKTQADALAKAIADEEANLALIVEENAALPQQVLDLTSAKGQAEAALAPLKQEEGEIKAEHAMVEKELADVRASTGELQSQLDALQQERETLRRLYEERSAELRERIDEPPWVYYGNKVRTKIMNVRPSMTGVFLPLGIGEGVKRDMEFLVRRPDSSAQTKRSWRFKLKIVQSDYSFAVILPEYGDQNIPMRAGEEIEMERSGNIAREKSEEETASRP
tara:strand:- start:270 stop:1175 length:906 start_codon:yes stop_codon:yes gene_type:complete